MAIESKPEYLHIPHDLLVKSILPVLSLGEFMANLVNACIPKIRWEISSECNLHCKHCFIGDKINHNDQINYQEAIVIIDRLIEQGLKEISFSSKEPLLFEHIDKLIAHCSSKGINVTLVTNGVLLENFKLAKQIMNSGVICIAISLEGISRESNDLIRGKGTFDKILTALKNINQLQKSIKHVNVIVQISLNNMNINELNNIPTFFNSIPIDSLVVGDITIDGNAVQNDYLKIDNDLYFNAIEEILNSYLSMTEKNYFLEFKSIMPIERIYFNMKYNTNFRPQPPKCSIIDNKYSLLSSGELVPCISLLDKNIPYPKFDLVHGNINYNKISLFKADLRNNIVANKNPECKNCYFNDYCLPCPAYIDQKSLMEGITKRCFDALNKINLWLKEVSSNASSYIVSVNNNTSLFKDGNKIKLTRMYFDGDTNSKQYDVNSDAISIIEFLYNVININLLELSNKFHFKSNELLLSFLKVLVFDDFINIRREQ